MKTKLSIFFFALILINFSIGTFLFVKGNYHDAAICLLGASWVGLVNSFD